MIFAIIFLIMNRTTFADRIALPLILFKGYVIGKIFSLLKYKMVKNIFILFNYDVFIYSIFYLGLIWSIQLHHGYHIKIFSLINENNIFYNRYFRGWRIRKSFN